MRRFVALFQRLPTKLGMHRVAFAVALLVVISACDANKTAADFRKSAEAYLDAGDFAAAEIELKNIGGLSNEEIGHIVEILIDELSKFAPVNSASERQIV